MGLTGLEVCRQVSGSMGEGGEQVFPAGVVGANPTASVGAGVEPPAAL